MTRGMTPRIRDLPSFVRHMLDEMGKPLLDPDALRLTCIELARDLEGQMKAVAKFQRRLDNVGRHVLELVDHQAGLKKDIKRLEDLLAWVHRTEQPLPSIREVIAKEIPRRIARESS